MDLPSIVQMLGLIGTLAWYPGAKNAFAGVQIIGLSDAGLARIVSGDKSN